MEESVDKIITANWFFGHGPQFIVDWETWYNSVVRRKAKRYGIRIKLVNEEIQVPAYVDTGRWSVKCPSERCRGQEYAWEEGYFMCMSCFNSGFGNCVVRSYFPPERTQIDQLLEQRVWENRCWLVGETLGQLAWENEVLQVPVPDGVI